MSHLPGVVEKWLEKDTPAENEAGRVIVKFLSKLVIPNEVLADWLTEKHIVY